MLVFRNNLPANTKIKQTKKCVCGKFVRGQFPAFKEMTTECRSLLSDLWEGIRMSFDFHDILLTDCIHCFHNNTIAMHSLTGKALISHAKNATANLLSRLFKQELISSELSCFFSKNMLVRLEHLIWRKFPGSQQKRVMRRRGVALFMSLLQTKRWIKLTPKSFIEATLVKHRETMTSSSPHVTAETHSDLFKIACEFGRGVTIVDRIPKPTQKATFEASRARGGYSANLKSSIKDAASGISIGVRGQWEQVDLFPIFTELYGPLKCGYLYGHFQRNLTACGFPIGPTEDPDPIYSMSCRCTGYLEKRKVDPRMIDLEKWSQNLIKERIAVKPVAIPEPLKVRVITKGNGFTFLLKMIQESMTEHLGTLPVFELTSGKTVEQCTERLRQKISEDTEKVFISGDYDAATDNLPLDVIKTVMDGILHTARNKICSTWMRKIVSDILLMDTSAHEVHYKDQVVVQTRGQLMGSLLSFPVLCLVNYASVIKARREPVTNKLRIKQGLKPLFHEDDILVNGDDLLFVEKPEIYTAWKQAVFDLGLSLSVGKNYISKFFGTINSRLLLRSAVLPVLRFGDLSSKASNVLEKWSSFCSQSQSEEELTSAYRFFKKRFAGELKKTNQSLMMPMCLGGPLPNNLFPFVNGRLREELNIDHALFQCYKYGNVHERKTFVIGRVRPALELLSASETPAELAKPDMWIRLPKKFNSWLERLAVRKDKLSVDSLFAVMKDAGFSAIRSKEIGINRRAVISTRNRVEAAIFRCEVGKLVALNPVITDVQGVFDAVSVASQKLVKIAACGLRGHVRTVTSVLRHSALRGILEQEEE